MAREQVPDLDPAYHHLSAADYDTEFQPGVFYIGKEMAPLGEIIDALKQTYCGSIGAEFMHIVDTEQRVWIQSRMDSGAIGTGVQRRNQRASFRALNRR